MEEREIGLNNITVDNHDKLPSGYIEDNYLKIFLDDTIDLGEVVSEVEDILIKEETNEIKINE